MPELELHIGEIIIDGFTDLDSNAIQSVIQDELTCLFSKHNIPDSLARGNGIPMLDGGTTEISRQTEAHTIGAQIAQAVYEKLK